MYGSSSDSYTYNAMQSAIRKMEEFGYDEVNLKEFSSAELTLMYDRLSEIKRKERIDSMIEKLNELSEI